jgi:hypothetical protein
MGSQRSEGLPIALSQCTVRPNRFVLAEFLDVIASTPSVLVQNIDSSSVLGWTNPLHIITFEKRTWGEEVTSQYSRFPYGVSFSSGPRARAEVVFPPQGTVSGTKALSPFAIETECFCDPNITISFASDQSLVKMAIGLDESTTEPVQATLTAFDKDNHQVGQPVTAMLGSSPISTSVSLEIASIDAMTQQPNIRRVVLTYDNGREVIDNLEFDNSGDRRWLGLVPLPCYMQLVNSTLFGPLITPVIAGDGVAIGMTRQPLHHREIRPASRL